MYPTRTHTRKVQLKEIFAGQTKRLSLLLSQIPDNSLNHKPITFFIMAETDQKLHEMPHLLRQRKVLLLYRSTRMFLEWPRCQTKFFIKLKEKSHHLTFPK